MTPRNATKSSCYCIQPLLLSSRWDQLVNLTQAINIKIDKTACPHITIFQLIFLMWSPLVRRHLYDLLRSVFQSSWKDLPNYHHKDFTIVVFCCAVLSELERYKSRHETNSQFFSNSVAGSNYSPNLAPDINLVLY